MKLFLSLLLLVFIGFNTHGQISPWVQIPTPGTERIENILQNGSSLYFEIIRGGRKVHLSLDLNSNNVSLLDQNNCEPNYPIWSVFYANSSLHTTQIINNIQVTSHYSNDGLCLGSNQTANFSTNRYIYLPFTFTSNNNFSVQHLITPNSPSIDSLILLINNLSNNTSIIKKYPSFGRFGINYSYSLSNEQAFLVTKFSSNQSFAFILNPRTTNFDSLGRLPNSGDQLYYANNNVFCVDISQRSVSLNTGINSWQQMPIQNHQGLSAIYKIQELEGKFIMSTNIGFFELSNSGEWVKSLWEPLTWVQKIYNLNGKIVCLAGFQLFQLWENRWEPYAMSGLIQNSTGALYANDQYMFFSNRYLSFNNGQSWFDQQRYFNSTPQNSIGSIQTMRPEAWFSLDMRNNEYFVYKSTNQGTTWQTVDRSFLGNPTTHSFSIARNSRWQQTDTLYATYGINFLRIARSTDAGNSWHDDANLNFQLPTSVLSVQGIACTLQVIGETVFLYTNTGKLLRATSRSTPFEEVYDFGPQNNIRVEILGNTDTVVVSLKPFSSNGRRFDLISTDGGRRFQEIRVPFPDQFASFALRRGQLWCANNGELSISNDLGRSFQRLYNPTDNFPFPNTAGGVATFNITDSMLFINGNHVAFYTRLPQGRVVSLAAEIQAPKEQLSLFPNPANERVFVKGLIKQENIRVFDLKGQEVLQGTISPDESLNLEQLPSGLYMVVVGQQRLKVLKR